MGAPGKHFCFGVLEAIFPSQVIQTLSFSAKQKFIGWTCWGVVQVDPGSFTYVYGLSSCFLNATHPYPKMYG